MEWKSIESDPPPMDGTPFLATLMVRHVSGRRWQESHVIWIDDETGDVHPDCYEGWELASYIHWMAIPSHPDAPKEIV